MFGNTNNSNSVDHLSELEINPINFFQNQGLMTPDAGLRILAACGLTDGGCTCGKAGCSCFYGSVG